MKAHIARAYLWLLIAALVLAAVIMRLAPIQQRFIAYGAIALAIVAVIMAALDDAKVRRG